MGSSIPSSHHVIISTENGKPSKFRSETTSPLLSVGDPARDLASTAGASPVSAPGSGIGSNTKAEGSWHPSRPLLLPFFLPVSFSGPALARIKMYWAWLSPTAYHKAHTAQFSNLQFFFHRVTPKHSYKIIRFCMCAAPSTTTTTHQGHTLKLLLFLLYFEPLL